MAATDINAPAVGPSGIRPKHLTVGRVGLYLALTLAAIFFLAPLYVMIVTSLKSMDEIRQGNVIALPEAASLAAWTRAWAEACTGLRCEGIQVGFWNSVRILIPSLIVSIMAGSIVGYVLSYWKFRGSELFYGLLLFGAFVPYQIIIYPLIRVFSTIGLYGSLPAIVVIHTVLGLPIMVLIFRNFYSTLPAELFKAARIDGAGFFALYWYVLLPISKPIFVVALILQVTGIWNDFLLGLIFGGSENMPMTVQLNNIVATFQGEVEFNTNMAATMLTALVPLAVYFVSGRWFVRGITQGAVKG